MTHSTRTLALLALCALSPANPLRGQSIEPERLQRYDVVLLQTLGGLSGNALGINAVGAIAGAADNAFGYRHACVWNGAIEDLDPASPQRDSEAWALNDGFDVVGHRQVSGRFEAVLWPAGGAALPLLPASPNDTFAHDVNDALGVVGTDGSEAFFWCPDGPATLPTLGGYSRAWAINEAGAIAGSSVDSSTLAEVPVVWEPDAAGRYSALPTVLARGSTYGVAYGINDAGHAVGWSNDPATSLTTAFVSYAREPGRDLTFLGTLPGGFFSTARAINARNQVVGSSGVGGTWVTHAFYWHRRAGMLDLNDLIPPEQRLDWELIQANDIADDGTIVGYGLHFPTGVYQGFALVPKATGGLGGTTAP